MMYGFDMGTSGLEYRMKGLRNGILLLLNCLDRKSLISEEVVLA